MKPFGAKNKAMLLVSHTTRLTYAEPVVEAHSEFRKTPVDTRLQRVFAHKLEVRPRANLETYRDYFGNHVHHFNRLQPHDELVIEAEAVVETTDAVCCGAEAASDGRPWSQRLAEFLHESPRVPALPEYEEIEHPLHPGLDADSFLDGLLALGATFQERFRYDPLATDVRSSPRDLFEAGGGVCQDFAHAALGVLRLGGIPCRYVSGYIYEPPDDDDGDALRGGSASHAWVQAWHPSLGWVGMDPTNDKLADWQYVQVAVGRDYSDAQPVQGVFVGPQEQRLEVEVRVERIG